MNTNGKIFRIIMAMGFGAVCLCVSGCDDSQPAESKTPKGKIAWIHSVSEGLALVKETGKPAFIDFYADWCAPCHEMDKTTFVDERVIAELARFVSIKADVSGTSSPGQGAAKEYNVQAIPTYVFIDTKGKKTIVSGYHPPNTFLKLLKGIK